MSHGERKHARFSMSNLDRIAACPGQPALVAKLRPVEIRSSYAEEGTKAHEILQTCITEGVTPATIAPTDAILQSVTIALDYVAGLHNEYPDLISVVEEWVPFPQDVVRKEDCGGSPDLILYSPSARRGWVIDLKHGAGRAVEVKGNRQLRGYACCYFYDKPITEVTLTVIQPRMEHPDGIIREEVIDALAIVEFAADVDTWLNAALAPEAPRRSGSHCRWCPVAAGCDAHEAAAVAAAREVFAGVQAVDNLGALPSPSSIPLDKIGRILQEAPKFQAFLSACEDYAKSVAMSGGYVPGWKLAETRARRKFFGDHSQIALEICRLSDGELGIDEVMPPQLKSLTDLEERLLTIAAKNAPHGEKTEARKRMKEAFAKLCVKETSGGLTLVPESDPRPGTNKAAQTFATVSLPPVHTPAAQIAPVNYLEGATSYADER